MIIIISILVSLGSGWYTFKNLSIDTNSTNLLSSDLPFRQDSIRLKNAFPQLSNNIAIVIDAPSAVQADDAALALTQYLRQKPNQFTNIFDPRGSKFFRQNSLLFLENKDLQSILDRLVSSQVLIGKLAQDPTIRGLFTVLTLILDSSTEFTATGELGKILEAVEKALEAEQKNTNFLLRIMKPFGRKKEKELHG